MNRRVLIGLDVGTTATKAVAFEVGGSWRRLALREYPMLTPEPGAQVQDPLRISAAVVSTLAEVVAPDLDVVGLSVSTAMHGLIGLDAQHTPLTPLVTWADARSTPQSRSLRTSGAAAVLYEISGVPVHPMTPLTKVMWFTEQAPDIAGRVRYWVGLKDYIVMLLTGRLATELSSASGTGLLDRRRRRWSGTAVEVAGISESQLPDILPTTAVLGLVPEVASQTGLSAGLPVVVGAADGPLGNVGTGALGPGSVGVSLGTSAAARMVVPQPTLDPHGRLFCYALTDELWVVGGALSTGASVVRWVRKVFGGDSDAEVLERAARVPAGSDGLVMIPYLLAERAPLWDPELHGAFLGVRSEHTRDHFVRAAVEGVGLQLSAIVAALDALTPVVEVRATGGAFRAQLWREVVAGCLERPLHVMEAPEGTARGAAALGLLGLGMAGDLPTALSLLEPAETLPPTRPSDVAVYRRLRAAVPALVAAYGEVASLFAR